MVKKVRIIELKDPRNGPAAQNGVSVIENGRLPGSDRPLRSGELDDHAFPRSGEKRRRRSLMPRTDFDIRRPGSIDPRNRDPIDVGDGETRFEKSLVRPGDDCVGRRIQRKNIKRARSGDAHPLPLADRVIQETLVASDDLALSIDDMSRPECFGNPPAQKRGVVVARNETDFLAFGFPGDVQSEACG